MRSTNRDRGSSRFGVLTSRFVFRFERERGTEPRTWNRTPNVEPNPEAEDEPRSEKEEERTTWHVSQVWIFRARSGSRSGSRISTALAGSDPTTCWRRRG